MTPGPSIDDLVPAIGLDSKALTRLLSGFDGSRVTLVCRTHLGDNVIDAVRDRVCAAAGREIVLETRVTPTMDAGAVLLVGDEARVILDPRTTWLSRIEREARDQLRSGSMREGNEAYAFLRDAITTTSPEPAVEELRETGSVVRIGDGIAIVSGLRDVGSQELVEFEGGARGLAISLKDSSVGVVLFDSEESVREGSDVRRTGRLLQIPAGQEVLGRVLDALGRPLDGGGALVHAAYMDAERPAPGVVDRRPVDEPLHTGMKVIDALVPIGRGQRELIIGDRKIGKTTLAVDTILAQKGRDVACIYCAIGQKASSVRQVIGTLERFGAMQYTAVVVALPGDMPALRYVAPYTATALGEYFMDHGGDALVIYDDLSKHAVTYREISALLDRPVGREAYPGDIFYVHSRLLERAARLSKERGSGSLTALPIVETLAGDISAFIPTNIISICDGQIMLDAAAFNEGRRPAMDPGLSVSRVGGTAQARSMKQVAGRLRIDLAQYSEMARFVKFGAEVDEATQLQLTRGERARALLGQDQHSPMPLESELVSLFAVVNGYLDKVAVADLPEMEKRILAWVAARCPDEMRDLATGEPLSEEATAELQEELAAFVATLSEGE
jgi:F-type H+-transporting ATPase subunit alpha